MRGRGSLQGTVAAEGPRVQGHPQLHGESEDSLGYTRPCRDQQQGRLILLLPGSCTEHEAERSLLRGSAMGLAVPWSLSFPYIQV